MQRAKRWWNARLHSSRTSDADGQRSPAESKAQHEDEYKDGGGHPLRPERVQEPVQQGRGRCDEVRLGRRQAHPPTAVGSGQQRQGPGRQQAARRDSQSKAQVLHGGRPACTTPPANATTTVQSELWCT